MRFLVALFFSERCTFDAQTVVVQAALQTAQTYATYLAVYGATEGIRGLIYTLSSSQGRGLLYRKYDGHFSQ